MTARKQGRWSPRRRIRAAGVLLVAGLLAGMAISWKLWLTDRDFPHLPCFEWFGPWPAPWDALLAGAVAAAMLGWLVRPQWRWLLGTGMALAVLVAVQDQVRWQPWFYLYLLALTGFLVPELESRRERRDGVLAMLRFLLVAMYFWSGFHKLGPGFDRVHQVAFEDPLRGKWGEGAASFLGEIQPAVPWIEILIALLLVIPGIRVAGVVTAVATHLWVLVLMGPLGTGDNEVVWPWNLCMALLVPVVFWNAPGFGWREMLARPCRYAAVPVVVLTGFMPGFSPGLWDRYFSFHLYSGKDQRIMLVLDEKATVALPPNYRAYLKPSPQEGLLELPLRNWCLKELKVPFPSEERMNLRIGKQLATLPFPPGAEVFFYFDYEFETRQRGWDMFTPGEMQRLKRFPEPRRRVTE